MVLKGEPFAELAKILFGQGKVHPEDDGTPLVRKADAVNVGRFHLIDKAAVVSVERCTILAAKYIDRLELGGPHRIDVGLEPGLCGLFRGREIGRWLGGIHYPRIWPAGRSRKGDKKQKRY